MISTHLLLIYLAALAAIYAVPGPDMALVLQTSIGRGVRPGMAAAAGLSLARTAHVTLSACGVAALIRSAPWLYEVIRYGGALYLAYVAIQVFRSPVFALGDDGRIVAVAAANLGRDIGASRRLIAAGAVPDPVKLADPAVNLKTFM